QTTDQMRSQDQSTVTKLAAAHSYDPVFPVGRLRILIQPIAQMVMSSPPSSLLCRWTVEDRPKDQHSQECQRKNSIRNAHRYITGMGKVIPGDHPEHNGNGWAGPQAPFVPAPLNL